MPLLGLLLATKGALYLIYPTRKFPSIHTPTCNTTGLHPSVDGVFRPLKTLSWQRLCPASEQLFRHCPLMLFVNQKTAMLCMCLPPVALFWPNTIFFPFYFGCFPNVYIGKTTPTLPADHECCVCHSLAPHVPRHKFGMLARKTLRCFPNTSLLASNFWPWNLGPKSFLMDGGGSIVPGCLIGPKKPLNLQIFKVFRTFRQIFD